MIYLEKELERIRTDCDFLNMVVTPQEFGGTLATCKLWNLLTHRKQ